MKEYGKFGMYLFVRCDNVSIGICFSVVCVMFIFGIIFYNMIIVDVYLIFFILIVWISFDNLEVGCICV